METRPEEWWLGSDVEGVIMESKASGTSGEVRKRSNAESSSKRNDSMSTTIIVNICRYRPRYHFDKKYIQYEVEVTVSKMSWVIYRRYSEFETFHRKLAREVGKLPKLPGKKWTGNMTAAFLEERRKALDVYLKSLTTIPEASTNHNLLEFLGFLRDRSQKKAQRVDSSALIKMVKPGDLVLFRTQGTLPALQRTVLSSEYDHVGILVQKEVSKVTAQLYGCDLFLLESTNEGVHTYPMLSRMRAWDHSGATIVIRRLSIESTTPEKIASSLKSFTKSVEGKNYSINPMKLLRRKAATKPDESFFCSELVASAYQNLGVLDKTIAASTFYPKSFAQKSGIKFTGGGSLGPEVIVDFRQLEVSGARRVSRSKGSNRSISVMNLPSPPAANSFLKSFDTLDDIPSFFPKKFQCPKKIEQTKRNKNNVNSNEDEKDCTVSYEDNKNSTEAIENRCYPSVVSLEEASTFIESPNVSISTFGSPSPSTSYVKNSSSYNTAVPQNTPSKAITTKTILPRGLDIDSSPTFQDSAKLGGSDPRNSNLAE
mmetsp:Transcript_4900/g.7259  ORF Transcript_4900/g.7259 Transcript_4900/m.7259 type:complete len:541 (+) Transcript_4900:12-1634(+)